MLCRSLAHLALPVAAAALWCGSVSALAGCNGGAATVRTTLPTGVPPPSGAPTSAPSSSPSSSGGLFAGIAPAASGSLSSPTPLATPASGAYTLAGLATYLDASKPPAAGAPVGLIGIVTAATTSSVTVTQLPMIAPNDANGNPIPYLNNVPQIGSFATPVTIDVDSSTAFANAGGLAKLVPGTMVAAAGSVISPSVLHASLLVPLAFGKATTSGRRVAPRGLAPSARRSLDYDTTVGSSFARKIDNLAPALKYNAPIVHEDTPPIACTDLMGNKTGAQGIWSISLVPQAVLSLGELDVHFPFNVSYAKNPPLFTQSGNTFSGPGSPTGWMAFNAKAGQSQTDYTAQLTAGADLGLSVTIGSTCAGAFPTVTLASATLGYAIYSGTTDALPGPSQKTQLKQITCIGLNEPLNINLFFDPASGYPNLNPFGDFTAANLSFCDQPTIGGALVTGSTNDIVDGSIAPSAFAFDPSQAGAGSISSFGAITPIGTPLSFNLTNLQYQPTYNDQYQLVYTVLGIPLISTPGGIPFHVFFAPLTAQDIPVSINATPQGLCASVYSGEVFGQPTGCAPGAINVVLCNKPNPTPTDMCQSGVTSSAEVAVTDPGFTGQLVIANALSGSCASVQSTDPITVTPQSAAGPTATFQITAGPQQVPDGQPMDCNVYIEQPANVPIVLEIHIIMPA